MHLRLLDQILSNTQAPQRGKETIVPHIFEYQLRIDLARYFGIHMNFYTVLKERRKKIPTPSSPTNPL